MDLEASLGLELPNTLKISLQVCNSSPSIIEKSCCLHTGGGGKLFDTNEIDELYKEMNLYNYYDGEAMSYSKVDCSLESNITWSKYFIPIYSWNCNEYALIDLRPESNNRGQILYVDPEFSVLGIWAKSYEEFLESIANAILDHGEFNQNDMKQIRDKIYKATKG